MCLIFHEAQHKTELLCLNRVAASIRKTQLARNFFELELLFLTAVSKILNFTTSRNDIFQE
jgi:hypothetical protein